MTRVIFLNAFLLFLITSCKKNDPTVFNGINDIPEATLDLGPTLYANFTGQVLDRDGNPLSGASVRVGSKRAVTDDHGVFVIKNADVSEKLAWVKVEKEGYYSSGRSLIPITAATNMVKVVLIPKELTATVLSGIQEVVSLPSGVEVLFKGEYVKSDGEPYEGAVNVYMSYLSPSDDMTILEMPGMLYAQNEDGDDGVLTTFGMLAVELEGEYGQPLQIANGSSALLSMPIEPLQLNNAPSTIPLWFFDEDAGYWIGEGSAFKEGETYKGEVKHFTFWNCDVFDDACTLKGFIISDSGDTLPSYYLNISTNGLSSAGNSNSDGSYFTYIAANQSVGISSYSLCNTPFSSNIGPFGSDSENDYDVIISSAEAEIINVTGKLYDCEGNPVSKGYVYIRTSVDSEVGAVEDGCFSVNVENCELNESFEIYGYDADSDANSGTLPFIITSSNMDIGNLTACNYSGGGEMLIYSIDGNPEMEYTTNILCREFEDAGSSYFEIYPMIDTSIHIVGEVVPIGTYYDVYPGGGEIQVNLPDMDQSADHDILINLTHYSTVGEIVSMHIVGTWTDLAGGSHTISGNLVVIRDI